MIGVQSARSPGFREIFRGALITLLCVTALLSGACAARSPVAEREIASLRSRVSELESARRRLNSQLKAMDARIVGIEARRGEPPRNRRLPVVRVRPRPESAEAPASVESSTPEDRLARGFTVADQGVGDFSAEPEEETGERPVLKLHESGAPGIVHSGGSSSRRPINLANVSERLPVVPIASAPSPDGAPAALPAPFDPDPPATTPVEEIVGQARRQVQGGQCGAALNALAGVISSSPEHPLAAEAMLLRARCFRRSGAHLRALGEAERMTRRYPSSARRPEAMLVMAEAYAALGDGERARDLYGQIMRRYPRSRAARLATARVQELGRGGRPREER